MELANRQHILSQYLPAIYQNEMHSPNSFLACLVQTFQSLVLGIEEILGNLPYYFDPDTTPPNDLERCEEILVWLASWVALGVDTEWLGKNVEVQKTVCDHREEKVRHLLKSVALLYERRGTPGGLQAILREFYGIEVEIFEWVWPYGMEIGEFSTIGVDTFILDNPPLEDCFVVVWKFVEDEYAPDEVGANWLATAMRGKRSRKTIQSAVVRENDPLYKSRFSSILQKIENVIDQEKPVHTSCYLSIEKGKIRNDQDLKLNPMVIGIQSVIESFYIH